MIGSSHRRIFRKEPPKIRTKIIPEKGGPPPKRTPAPYQPPAPTTIQRGGPGGSVTPSPITRGGPGGSVAPSPITRGGPGPVRQPIGMGIGRGKEQILEQAGAAVGKAFLEWLRNRREEKAAQELAARLQVARETAAADAEISAALDRIIQHGQRIGDPMGLHAVRDAPMVTPHFSPALSPQFISPVPFFRPGGYFDRIHVEIPSPTITQTPVRLEPSPIARAAQQAVESRIRTMAVLRMKKRDVGDLRRKPYSRFRRMKAKRR